MRTTTGVLGFLLATATANAWGDRDLGCVARELREFCRANEFPDGTVWPRAEVGRRFLSDYGDHGLQALLELAAESSRDGKCALEILRVASVADALPIARSILRRRRAPVFMRAEALATVAHFRDTQSLEEVLAAFRSGDRGLVGPSAHALGVLGDPRGWAELRSAVKQPKYVRLEYAILRGMAQPGHEQAVSLIIEAVANGKDHPASGCLLLWQIGGVTARRGAIALLERVSPIQRAQIAEDFRWSLAKETGLEPDPDVAADIAALDRMIEAAAKQQQPK